MFFVKPRTFSNFPPSEVSNIKLGWLLIFFCKTIFVSAPPTKPKPFNLEIFLSRYISNLPLSIKDSLPNDILPYAID